MEKSILSKIEETFKEYITEMQAQGAWSGHTYAPTELNEVYKQLQEIIKSLKDIKEYKYDIKADMFIDYDGLITKVYKSDSLSMAEKGDVSDMISEKFISALDAMVEIVSRYYRNETGWTLLDEEYN